MRHIACVNALSGLYLIVTVMLPPISSVNVHRVSMPSRAYTSLLRDAWKSKSKYEDEVSMPSRAYTSLLQNTLGARAFLKQEVSMPSRAYTSLLRVKKSNPEGGLYVVSMPSRAYTSLLQYPFKNLGFMRFPEPVFAGIYQNILTIVVFRAC